MNVRSGSQRRHPVLWATARLCAGVRQEEVYPPSFALQPLW